MPTNAVTQTHDAAIVAEQEAREQRLLAEHLMTFAIDCIAGRVHLCRTPVVSDTPEGYAQAVVTAYDWDSLEITRGADRAALRRITIEAFRVWQAEHVTDPPSKPASQSILESLQAIRDAARCPTCDKTRAVVNLGALGHRRRIQAERVSLETHCSCEGGPARHLVNPSQERAS